MKQADKKLSVSPYFLLKGVLRSKGTLDIGQGNATPTHSPDEYPGPSYIIKRDNVEV